MLKSIGFGYDRIGLMINFFNLLENVLIFLSDFSYISIFSCVLLFIAIYLSLPLVICSVFLVFSLFFVLSSSQLAMVIFVVAIMNIPILRRYIFSKPLIWIVRKLDILPDISPTEKEALDAGVVWYEKEIFSGKPSIKNLLKIKYPKLTKEEKDFLNGPVEKFCNMVDEWEIWKKTDLPSEAWQFLKDNKFFGMIIPKEYGGLGFSNLAHSEVIKRLATRSTTSCITVMVPNSLGPGELLIHYGNKEQKERLLPRLANGKEIPCFALTEPTAGSDASSIQSSGVLFKGDDGQLYIKLNWKKRWITLAAISTTLGLAFKLRDPDKLIGDKENIGITCALIPSNTPGIKLGRRHDPMGIPFYNCPTEGVDVIVKAQDAIIGGIKQSGKGWGMLMDCLAAGRGVSLPAQSAGGCDLSTKIVSSYAAVRKQFGLAIGRFEGVQENLARIVGLSYIVESSRRFTLCPLDEGIKPPIVTAIAKYQSTEMFRKVINSSMDIVAGAAISRGPRNMLSSMYIATPIGITVEGANILTRTLIIFGQGIMRAHPCAYEEVKAITENNLVNFDKYFWRHIGHVLKNMVRSIWLNLTGARFVFFIPGDRKLKKYYKKLYRTSANFAIMSDIAMGVLGGKLKQKEILSGRFADVLSWSYLCISVLRRYEEEKNKDDLAIVEWSLDYGFHKIQEALLGICDNFGGLVGLALKFNRLSMSILPISKGVNDRSTIKVASSIQNNLDQRNRLCREVFVPKDPNDQLNKLEKAFMSIKEVEDIDRKIRKARRKKIITKQLNLFKLYDVACEANIITKEERQKLYDSRNLCLEAITVDCFSLEEYKAKAT